MIDIQAFTDAFSFTGQKVRTWCRLLGLEVTDYQVANAAAEQLTMMRYLLERIDEADALALIGLVVEDVGGPIPVFSIVNESLLVIGAGELQYRIRTAEKVEDAPEVVYTSIAVNVEAFASALLNAGDARRRRSSVHQAPDADDRRSQSTDPVCR